MALRFRGLDAPIEVVYWKGGSKAVPDPTQQIAAEQNANQYNIVSPTGSINYSKDPTGRTTQTTTLSPTEQRQLDTSNQIAETMLSGAQKKIPGISDTTFDYNNQGSTAAKAAYQRQVDLLTPEFAKQDTSFEDRMANAGIPLGGEAYNDALRQHENDKNFALTQAAQQAETEGTGLALSQRQQQYNELAAALGGQQLNPVGAFSQAAAPVDVAGAYAQKNQAQIAQQMGQTQQNNALLGAAAQLGGAYLGSKRPSGAGGQAATTGATQSYTAPSNYADYSTSAPNVTDTAGGTTTYFGEPSDGLDYVTPSVSKIGDTAAAPSTGWLGTVGKGVGAANDAYNLYSGINAGGVKGAGTALAAGSSLAGLAGAGGAGATTLGAVGNAAAGNYVGAAKNLYDLYKGYTAASGAAGGTAAGASAGEGAASGASGALSTALPLFLAYNLGQGLVNSSSDPKAAANRAAYSNPTNVNSSLLGYLGTNGTPALKMTEGTGSAQYPIVRTLSDGTRLNESQWNQLMGLYQNMVSPYTNGAKTTSADITRYLSSLKG